MKKQTKLGLVLAAAAVISVSVASLVSARGWVQQGADWYYVDNNGDYVTGTIQSSGNAKFYLDEDTGAMQRDYLLQDYNGNTYYFGSNGAMVTNTWVAVDSSIVDSGADYIPDNFWFYFQASGKAVKASSGVKKTTIDGKKYAFSEDGTMLTGWIADGKTVDPDDNTNPFAEATYYAGGDNDGVLRSGWVTYYDGYDGDDTDAESDYTNLYFYFNPSNNTKEDSKTKKINGRTYAFSNEGVMLSGWDAADSQVGGLVPDTAYFSGEDDGHQVKKGWVYAVPTIGIDPSAFADDEEKYMYFNASGAIVTDTFKKINGKYYVFNGSGIMKTGLVIWNPSATAGSRFVDTFDLDWANGSDLAKKGKITTGQTTSITVDSNCSDGTATYAIYNFADDGSRKDGSNTVTFADDDYTFVTNAAGHKPSGSSAKKYYSLGIQLKASADVKYGIYATNLTAGGALTAQSNAGAITGSTYLTTCTTDIATTPYYVLNTSGSKVKGKAQGYKDADGNYWLLDKTSGALKGIWTVNVKYADAKFTTREMKNTVGIATQSYEVAKAADNADLLAEYNTTVSAAETSAGGNIDTVAWVAKLYDNQVNVAFTSKANIKGYWFQSDYGDKSNVWIPFGIKDNVGHTCDQALSQADYLVTPTDDYFLNCYWAD